jgi:hypothetical protein
MADDDGLCLAERRHQRHHVSDRVEDGVGGDVGGSTRSAEAAHVGCDDMEAGVRDCADLVTPGIGQFGPAVAQHDERAFALFPEEQLDVVRDHGA